MKSLIRSLLAGSFIMWIAKGESHGFQDSVAIDGEEQCASEIGSEEEVLMQTRTNRPSKTGCGTPNCPCDRGICYMFGDPHFFTFDGASTVINQNMRAKYGTYYLVHTDLYNIQFISGMDHYVGGVAFSGPFLKGHKLVFVKDPDGPQWGAEARLIILWDDKKILKKPNSGFTVPGLVDVQRRENDVNLRPTEQQFKKLYGKKNNWWKKLGVEEKWLKFANKTRNFTTAYHLKLPYNAEVYISGPADWLQVMLVMNIMLKNPGGYCGNFNGDPDDDKKPTRRSWGWQSKIPKNTELDLIDAKDDLFKQSGISYKFSKAPPKRWLSLSSGADETSAWIEAACPDEVMERAKESCKGILDSFIRNSCEQDVCVTNETTVGPQEAFSMEMHHLAVAEGSVEFAGHAKCSDGGGEQYTTVDSHDVLSKVECNKLLHRISHHMAHAEMGVKGIQFGEGFTDEDSLCQLVLEAGGDYGKDSLGKIPGLWKEEVKPGSGTGMVSNSEDVDEGWSCWRIV